MKTTNEKAASATAWLTGKAMIVPLRADDGRRFEIRVRCLAPTGTLTIDRAAIEITGDEDRRWADTAEVLEICGRGFCQDPAPTHLRTIGGAR